MQQFLEVLIHCYTYQLLQVEFGIDLNADLFDQMHQNAHYLLDIRPAGKYPAEYFYYAGGVPAVMEAIKENLNLDVMTVTGKTLGENLEELKNNGYYENCQTFLDKINLKSTDIIRPYDDPHWKRWNNCHFKREFSTRWSSNQTFSMSSRNDASCS